jgi:hypothetical protein
MSIGEMNAKKLGWSFKDEVNRFLFLFYYESRKRDLKTRLIHENRCDERLKN